jgi:hypothetical protein
MTRERSRAAQNARGRAWGHSPVLDTWLGQDSDAVHAAAGAGANGSAAERVVADRGAMALPDPLVSDTRWVGVKHGVELVGGTHRPVTQSGGERGSTRGRPTGGPGVGVLVSFPPMDGAGRHTGGAHETGEKGCRAVVGARHADAGPPWTSTSEGRRRERGERGLTTKVRLHIFIKMFVIFACFGCVVINHQKGGDCKDFGV